MGALIRDRYEPLGVVGRGGQGEVVRALDHVHDRQVALKVRRIGSASEREIILSEARILLGVQPHPNLAMAREDFIVGDDYYLVMDWVEGRDLRHVLAFDGTPGLEFDRVMGYLGQAAVALDHLHDQHPPVVHGDVKPANLILSADGRVTLVDFGISHQWGNDGERRWGTPQYTAPELATGAPGPAADVYGLAVTAYALLTGAPPEPEVRPAVPGLPPDAEAAVVRALRRGLATDPALRPPTPVALVEAIRAAAVSGPAPGEVREDPVRECPYRGLYPFREQDARFFFGREDATRALVQRVSDGPFVAVVGASGSGKSSLVWAGLVPSLRRDGGWMAAGFRPGVRPFHALAAALLPDLEPGMTETERLVEVDKLAVAIDTRDGFLADVSRRVREKTGFGRLLLVVDQFEELYTVEDSTVRHGFIDRLLEATTGTDPAAHVVVTLRADFLGHALAHRPLADALQRGDLKLGPMTVDELRSAVEQPALASGVSIEDGLTRRLLTAVADEPGNLPLLEFALTMLWGRQEHGFLTHAAYERMGGVERALAGYADEVFEGLRPGDQDRAKATLLQLVRPGEGTEDTRRAASRAEIGEDNWRVVGDLAAARLVVTGRDDATGAETVEVVHEALIQQWGRLRRWMATERSFRSWQERLRAALRQWEASGWDEGALLRGAPLAEAADWIASRPPAVNAAEAQFVEASQAAAAVADRLADEARARELDQARALAEEHRLRAEAERARARQQARSSRLLRLASLGLVVLLVVAVATAAAVRDQRNESRRLRLVALTEAMAARVGAELEERLDERAILVARQAYLFDRETGGSRNPVVDRALRQALGVPNFSRILGGYRAGIAAAVPSPDGRFLATAASAPDRSGAAEEPAGTGVQVRNLENPDKSPIVFAGHKEAVTALAWRPDGSALASGSRDGTVRLWEPERSNGEAARVLRAGSPVTSVAFTPSGDAVAAGSSDGSLRIWSLSDPETGSGRDSEAGDGGESVGAPLSFSVVDGEITDVVFHPIDGKVFATGGSDGRVSLWDVAAGKALSQADAGGPVRALAFESHGKGLAVGTGAGTVALFDLGRDHALGSRRTLSGHTAAVNSVAFASDGKIVASGGDDRAVRIWRPGADTAPLVLTGHTGRVSSVAFTGADTPLLITGSEDKTVRLWEIGDSSPTRQALPSHQGQVAAVTFSPDGRRLATAGADDRSVHVHDLARPERDPVVLSGHSDDPTSVVFSADGARLASAARDGTIRLWDTEDFGTPPVVIDAGAAVYDVDFDPDGEILAAALGDGTVRIYDVDDRGRLPLVLRGHEGEVTTVAFSPDGRRLVSGSADSTVRVWNANRPTADAKVLRGHTDRVHAVAWSPDGSRLASGGADLTVRIWRSGPGGDDVPAPVFRGPTGEVDDVAFSPDSRTVAAASDDGKVRIWEIGRSDAAPLVLRSHPSGVTSVAFSPDGGQVVSGGEAGTLVVEPTRTATLATYACRRVGRDLTAREWKELVGPALPYRPVCSQRST